MILTMSRIDNVFPEVLIELRDAAVKEVYRKAASILVNSMCPGDAMDLNDEEVRSWLEFSLVQVEKTKEIIDLQSVKLLDILKVKVRNCSVPAPERKE